MPHRDIRVGDISADLGPSESLNTPSSARAQNELNIRKR